MYTDKTMSIAYGRCLFPFHDDRCVKATALNISGVCLNTSFISFLSVTISANGTIQLATPGSEGLQGLQAVTTGGAQQGTTVLQYAQTPDGQQILVPSNQVVVQGQSTMKCSLEQTDSTNKSADFLATLLHLLLVQVSDISSEKSQEMTLYY